MQKDQLTFHLTRRGLDTWSEESDAFSQDFIHSLGLKVQSGCWCDIDLDSPEIHDFIKKAWRLIAEGKAEFYGYNMLRQRLVEDDATHFDWYCLQPSFDFAPSYQSDGVATIKAYTMPPNSHVALTDIAYVSERFKSVVEEHDLTGLDFVWVKDTGKFRAVQWFIPVALRPLGRGVDHPWFNPATLKGSDSWQPRSRQLRTGVWSFDHTQLKPGLRFENPIYAKIFDLYNASPPSFIDLEIRSYLRFLRADIPETDFAFVWRGGDIKLRGVTRRQKGLCMNRKARDILLEHRIVSEDELEPILILDDVPDGCELLDGIAPMPNPVFTPAEIEDLKQKLASDWQKHLLVEKPVRAVSMKEVLKLLRREKKKRPEDFAKGMGRTKGSNVETGLPRNWLTILSVSDGCHLNRECTLVSTDEMAELSEEKSELVSSAFDEYPYDCAHIPVGTAFDGDWFSLESKSSEAVDSRVFRVSHEDLSIVFEWDSIPLFLFDMLTGFYD